MVAQTGGGGPADPATLTTSARGGLNDEQPATATSDNDLTAASASTEQAATSSESLTVSASSFSSGTQSTTNAADTVTSSAAPQGTTPSMSMSMAPATPAPTSNTPASASNSSGGLSTAAKAGIAVGAVVVVAILAAALFWKFCYGRKKSARRGVPASPYGPVRADNSGPINSNAAEKGLPAVGGAVLLRSDSSPSETATLLPQQADDATIQSRFSTLFDQIELHAENFYKDASPMIPPQTEAALSRYDTPYLGGPLAARLEESPRATTILKHVLAYEIAATSLTCFSQDRKRSLLPPPLLALLQELESRPTSHPERRAISTRLKTLAQTYHTSPQSMPTSTISATRESAAQFSQTFSLWSDAQHDEPRRTKHLGDIFDSAVGLSIWLLRQPEDFEVRWGPTPAGHGFDSASDFTSNIPDSSRDGTLVTHPALVKVSRNAGATRLSRSEQKTIAVAIHRRV